MACSLSIALPGFPRAPEDALEALRSVGDALVDEVGGAGWSVEPEVSDDVVVVVASRTEDGLRYSLRIHGTWAEGPPERWELGAEARMLPTVTQADKIIGGVVVAVCFTVGIACGWGGVSAVWWMWPEAPVLAGLAVGVPAALLGTLGSLVAAVFVTPRSAPPPVPDGVSESFDRAVEAAVDTLVGEGTLTRP